MMQKIHLKAPDHWINDPNGFIYYKGYYHMFYQYFPYDTRWGTMHWGHAVSRDLVQWEHKGIALFPSKYDDRNGCFSGSAIEHEGKLYLYYTGTRYLEENPEDIHVCLNDRFAAAQMMMVSEDGLHFDNWKDKITVIPPLEDESIGCRTHTRDPKVWRGKDVWYMILGTRREKTKGGVLFYRSRDLRNWEYVNFAGKDEEFSWMWECPDYFVCDGRDVLIVSPIDLMKDGKTDRNQAICFLVDFEEETCRMQIPEEYQFLDYGMDLYAPQSALDAEGRRVLTAWARMPESPSGDWIGMYCIPRVAEVKENHIYFHAHPNIRAAFTRRIERPAEADVSGYRLEANMQEGDVICIGGYEIVRIGNRIRTDRSRVFRNHQDYRMQFETPELMDGCHVEVYVEPNLIEVFVNDGEYVITNVVYDLGTELQTECEDAVKIYTVE